MSEWQSFVDILVHRAEHTPQTLACRFLAEDGSVLERTYAELDTRARGIAARLMTDTQPGDRVLLLFEPGLSYVEAFFGCLYAGAIAVPAYPPTSAAQVTKLVSVQRDSNPAVVLGTALTTAAVPGAIKSVTGSSASGQWICLDEISGATPLDGTIGPRRLTADTTAFLQYTSGTTAEPKGVMIGHGNLIANSTFIAERFGHTADSHGVIWLPPYHDMGLIGGILQPVFAGFPVTLMSPLRFLRDPFAWLQAISTYGGTTSGGPPFAFDLCTRKISEEQRKTLDLSTWSVAFVGAEPVGATTLRSFAQNFAPCGFDLNSFFPCYGMAEATLMIAGTHLSASSICSVDPTALAGGTLQHSTGPGAHEVVACGTSDLGDDLVVVDAKGHAVADGKTGEIWFAGAGVAQGYWRRGDDSDFVGLRPEAPGRKYLRTGDIGVRWGDQVVPISRLKDVIIVRGRNHAPDEIEKTAASADRRLRIGSAAAFTVASASGSEVWVVLELTVSSISALDLTQIDTAVRTAVTCDHGISVGRVVLVRRGGVLKTSSGKVRRSACREAVLDGTLEPITPTSSPEDIGSHTGIDDLAATRMKVRVVAAEILQIELADLADDRPLTAVGLDSVGVVQLRARLQVEHGLSVDLALLLGGASIASAASAAVSAEAPYARSTQAPRSSPLTCNETAMWFLQQLAPRSRAYHLCHAIDVVGEFTEAALDRAVEHLVARHNAFRTSFPIQDGYPIRRLGEPTLQLRHIGATDWSDQQVAACMSDLANTFLDIAHGPLWRIWHLDRGGDRHVLAVVAHHIVTDLWSMTLVARELIGELAGLTTATMPPPAGMHDVARDEPSYLSSTGGRADLSVWTALLGDAVERAELPTDRPRVGAQTFNGAELAFDLSPALTSALHETAALIGVTPYVVVLTALYWSMSKHTGMSDLTVGAPASGRMDPMTHDIVGLLVNTVPLRVRLRDGDTFGDAVRGVATMLGSALSAQRYPFSQLVRHLPGPPPDAGRNPMFDIVMTWQQPPNHDLLGRVGLGVGSAMVGKFELQPRRVDTAATPFDMVIELLDDGPSVNGRIRYNSDLWDCGTVESLAKHWQHLLSSVLEEPGMTIDDVEIIDAAETDRLLRATAATTEPSRAVRLDTLIASWATRTPSVTAIQDATITMNYADLEDRVARGAAWLCALGVGPEVSVGILMDRSAAFVVAALTVMRAGGAYVPLDPTHPAVRLTRQIDDAGLRLVLTEGCPELVERIALSRSGRTPRFVEVSPDTDAASPPKCLGRLNHDWQRSVDTAAYVMYTSGTTGTPKGVSVSHRSVVNLLDDLARRAPLHARDRCAWWTKASFDLSVYEIFSALMSGGTLVIVPAEVHLYPSKLTKWLADNLITAAYVPLFAVPALVDLAELRSSEGASLALRRLTVGVEPVPGSLLRRITDSVPGLRVLNAYGPTETTIIGAVCDDPAAWTDTEGTAAPIGGPVNDSPLYVLDQRFGVVPVGVTGEVYIGGVAVSRGYLGRPRETASAFVPDPRRPGARMYRTGDRGRWDQNNRLRFAGRSDRQVKLRGVRIELGEVESALAADPRVHTAVADVRPGSAGDVLVGYVILRPGTQTTQDIGADLVVHSRRLLPTAMVPSTVILLERLPMTSSGKLDRAALPSPSVTSSLYDPPLQGFERTIATIWSDILGGARVGRHDDFFALGGHSLQAAQATMRLGDILGRQIEVALLFAHPTTAGLSEALTLATPAHTQASPPILDLPRAGQDFDTLKAQIDALPEDLVRRLLGTEAHRS